MMIVHLKPLPAPLDLLRVTPTIAPAAADLLKTSALAVVKEGGIWHVYNAPIVHENLVRILKMPGGVRRISEYTATTARVESSSPSVDSSVSPGYNNTSSC